MNSVGRTVTCNAIGLAWSATAPALLRLTFSDSTLALVVLTIGASLALWGMGLGALLRSSRPFELTVLVLAYIGIQDDGPLNVLADPAATLLLHGLGLPLACGLLLVGWRALTAPDQGRAGRIAAETAPRGAARVPAWTPASLSDARPR